MPGHTPVCMILQGNAVWGQDSGGRKLVAAVARLGWTQLGKYILDFTYTHAYTHKHKPAIPANHSLALPVEILSSMPFS